MNTKNTNEKKTLKKGRKGWVVAAAIVATIAGASALNQPSQTTPILTKTGQPSSPTTKAPSATVKEEKKSPTTAPEVQNPTVKVTAGTHFSEPVSGQTQTNNSEQKSNPSSDNKPSSSVKVEVNLGAGATTAKEKDSTPKIVAEVKADSSEKVTEKKSETGKDEKAKTETTPEVASPVKPVPGKVLSAPTVKEEKSETKPVTDEKKPAPVKEEAPKTPTVSEKQPKTETVKEETPKAEKPADTPQKQGETKVTEKVTDSKSEQKTSSDTSQVPSGQGQTVGGTTVTPTGETSTTVTEPAKGSETVTTPEVTPTPETGAEGETSAPVVPVTPVAPIISKIITTRTEVERTEILRGTQFITDDSMEVGQQVVDTEGNDGYTLNSYTVTLEDGLEVSRVLSGTSTVPAVDKVVRVGSKVVHQVVRETKEVTETTPILRGTRYVEDDTLLEGTQVVESEGRDGETVTKYSVVTEDGTEVSRTQTSTETKEATDKVVRVGTKKKIVTTTETVQEEEVVNFTTETKEDKSLDKGQRIVDVKGQDGKVVKTYTVTKENGTEVKRELSNVERTKPTTEVVRVGAKEVTTETVTEEETLHHETVTKNDTSLDKGQRIVDVKGQDGKVVKTYTVTKENGQEVKRELSNVERTEPITEVVRVGAKEVTTETVTEEEVVNYTTTTKSDVNLDKGQRVVDVQGQDGKVVKTYTVTKENGVEVKRELTNTERIEPTTEVVRIGAKNVTVHTFTKTEKIPYTTKIVERADWFENQRRVVTQGKDGKTNRLFQQTFINGVGSEPEYLRTETIPAVDKVIEVGTRQLISTIETKETTVLPSQTVRQPDSSMNVGETRTVQGEDGFVEHLVTKKVNNRTGEVLSTEKTVYRTKEATDTIEYYGTKEKVVDADDVVLPEREVRNPELVKEKYQLDVKNEDHRSTKKLHAQMSQAQKDKVSANQFDPDLIAAYRTTGLSQDDMNKLERILDVNKLNQEFATLLNRERASKGLAPATIADVDSPLAKVATVRANEMADYGSLRYKGVKEGKHKRPDGSSWMTAYTQDELKQYGRMGENAAESSGNHWNIISITNEKYLADKFFTNWKNSPGHYKIMMMDAPNIQFYLSLGFANHSMTSGLTNAHNVVAMMEVGSKNR
jgi:IgA-specific serine endopeptidase